jgi:LEA14-like dessication related protein
MALIGGGIYTYKRFSTASDNVDVSFNSSYLNSLDGGHLNLDLNFLVENRNNMNFVVTDLNVNIYINDVLAGNSKLVNQVDIPSMGSAIVSTNTNIDVSSLESGVQNILVSIVQGHGTGINLGVQGYCTIRMKGGLLSFFDINVPINETKEL